MKNVFRFLLITFNLFVLSNLLLAQWIQTNGPYGGNKVYNITSLAVLGTNIFAGTSTNGVLLSTDTGINWTRVNSGLTDTNITALAVLGTNIFVGTSSHGIFLSTDNGTSWMEKNSAPLNNLVRALAVLGTNLYAATYVGGVYVSTNNGTSWNNSRYTEDILLSLAAAGTNLLAGTYGYGVYLSTDNGTNWVRTGVSDYVYTCAISGTNFYIGKWSKGVFLSTDNGTNWSAINSGLTDLNITALAVYGTNIFAGTNNGGVFLSTNNGSSWVYSGLQFSSVQAFARLGTNLYAGTKSGLFFSTNNGTSWTAINLGPANPTINALAVTDTNLVAGTSGYGIYLSINNGTNWVNTALQSYSIRAFTTLGKNLFAGTSNGVFLSTDNGSSWIRTNLPNEYSDIYSLAISDTNIFAGGSSGSVFLSTDNGTNWLGSSLTYATIYSIVVLSNGAGGANLFAGTDYNYKFVPNGGIYLSTNNGTSWSSIKTGWYVYALAVSGTDLFAGTDGGGIFLSTDNGLSWNAINTGLTNTVVHTIAIFGTKLLAGTDGGVFLSENNGTSWVNMGLQVHSIQAFAFLGLNLYAGTGNGGVWRRPLSDMITSVKSPSTNFPESFILCQNYPNPFNPMTTISFSLPSKSFVSLKVFDIIGREVATIVSEELSAGTYSRQWYVASMPSGVYLYRLQSGSYIQTKKLVLLK